MAQALAVIVVVALVVALIVVPFAVRAARPRPRAAARQAPGALPPPAPPVHGNDPAARAPAPAAGEDAGRGGRIDGPVKASALKAIAEQVDAHPDETVRVLRRWMNEDG